MRRSRRQIKQEAEDFAIWRAAESMKWGCDAGQIARATGFSVSKVRRTCLRRGWPIYAIKKETEPMDVDMLMLALE